MDSVAPESSRLNGPGRAGLATVVFLGIAFAVSYAGQIAVWFNGGVDGSLFGSLAPFLMFSPALAAFVALRLERRPVLGVLRGIGRVQHYALAVLVPAVTALLSSLVIHAWLGAGPSPVQLDGLNVVLPDRSPFFGPSEQPLPLFAVNFLATSTVYAGVGGLLALGEEVGWRGYLQPRLTEVLGPVAGMAAVGLLWWLWHVPILLQGYVFPDAPLLGAALLFPVVAVMLSFFLGWLRARSDSIWPATLAHGSYNAAFAMLVFRMDFGSHALAAYGIIVAFTAATGSVFLALVAGRRGGPSS